jgi:Arc/MetJ family transcription regulator
MEQISLNIDKTLLDSGLKITGMKTYRELVDLALHEVLRRETKKKATLVRGKEFHDLDHLFGSWTEEEFREIQGRIDADRKIDEELWR